MCCFGKLWVIGRFLILPFSVALFFAGTADGLTNPNVYVSRFWHNHQPLYWPEWNSNGAQTNRGQYAWDSIVLKPGQNYGGLSPKQHPENNLTDIFGLDDRKNAYQQGPRNSLSGLDTRAGFGVSYSGSLIDNVRQLGNGGHLGYQGNWNAGYREARGWKTPSGSTRMDMLGFTSHHSLGPLLPKSVFQKEIQVFKQAWWKAWGGNSDLSDHSKGFFPTEMAYSRHLVDVLVDEGFEWTLVASHHISRTSPSYNDKANPEGSFNIKSSPPNRADQISPRFDNASQWWFGEPNPGNAAWNVAPFAYQLHRVKYVNPETGVEKKMYAVPSDDVLSYRYGYANEGIGKIVDHIAPHANVPVIVIPSTDGDNAWGGGSSSWFEATPQLFSASAGQGYKPSAPQDFVNAAKAGVTTDTHIEDGAWIFPEMCYGSPNFMKWIEPPVATVANRGVTTVPGTQIDMETPGFALKFYSYAPLMAGANWVETAEQILRDEGGSVQAWKIQAPYDWDGTWTNPNDVELAWHIYLKGLDSGFNYYGGLGNDDEVKPGLATRRAIEKLQPWMTTARRNNDRTAPTVLKPQRFPYNPGGYTFGWFNQQPHINNNGFLKRMNSDFYIWTHAYDLSGIPDGEVKLKIRIDNDGTNPLASNQNETFAGGSEVGTWVTLNMTKRVLPKTRETLNAAAANPVEIDYFLPSNEQADYYFVKITDTNLPNFRSKLLDYYIEATDAKGNVHKSEIQHVWVDDFSGQTNGSGGGGGTEPSTVVTTSPNPPVAGQPVTVTYNPAGRNLAAAPAVNLHYGFNDNIAANWTTVPGVAMVKEGSNWKFTYTVPANATIVRYVFNNGSGTWDNNGGGNWNINVSSAPPPTEPPPVPTGLQVTATTSTSISLAWTPSATATSYIVFRNGNQIGTPQDPNYVDSSLLPENNYTYTVRAVNVAGSSASSSAVSGSTSFAPLNPNQITVVDPATPGQSSGSPHTFRGRAGAAFTNGLTWSNPATGATGLVAFPGGSQPNGWEWTASVGLGAGANAVTFSGTYATSSTQTLTDSPANYTGWSTGGTGGTGFGAWSLTSSGSGGHFLAQQSVHTNMSVGASTGFGLWANTGGISTATRNFNTAMSVGDSFFLRFDNNWIDPGGETGFALADSFGNVKFRFYFVGGQNNYRITDATAARDTGWGYTGNGLSLAVTLGAGNAYTFADGTRELTGTLASAGGAIARLIIENKSAGPDMDRNLYIGAMTHTRQISDSGTISSTASTLTYNPTTDGIANSWWDQYSVPTGGRVAANDADGDGFTNAQENALGTSPVDASSTFKVGAMQRTGNTLSINWPSVPGKVYQVQKRASLNSGDWIPVGANVPASSPGSSTSATVDVSDSPNASFVRVILVP
jgi:Starch/carbohydrate-binding module (family 53)/Glycosyl hydrolase family 57